MQKYGENFASEYGWFAATIQPNNPKYKPNFTDVEEKVGLSYLRPFYKWASNEIHAQSSGLYEKLGLLPDMEIKLAGSSIFGLSHPAQWATIHLYLATGYLLSQQEDFYTVITLKACQIWIDDICSEFAKADEQLEKDNSGEQDSQ